MTFQSKIRDMLSKLFPTLDDTAPKETPVSDIVGEAIESQETRRYTVTDDNYRRDVFGPNDQMTAIGNFEDTIPFPLDRTEELVNFIVEQVEFWELRTDKKPSGPEFLSGLVASTQEFMMKLADELFDDDQDEDDPETPPMSQDTPSEDSPTLPLPPLRRDHFS